MAKLICGCGRFILEVKNGSDNEYTGECVECNTTHQGAYNNSSAWREDPLVIKYKENLQKPKLRAVR